MYCRKCGAQNMDDAAFCVACGEKIQVSAANQTVAPRPPAPKPPAPQPPKPAEDQAVMWSFVLSICSLVLAFTGFMGWAFPLAIVALVLTLTTEKKAMESGSDKTKLKAAKIMSIVALVLYALECLATIVLLVVYLVICLVPMFLIPMMYA